jgi:Rhs element Vgr protein
MPAAARALPIPAAHRALTVTVDGVPVPREHQLLSATVTLGVNRLAQARLAWLDGAAAASDFPLSGSALFVPGARVAVLGGAGEDDVPLFTGVVVRHALKVREDVAPQLVVECRHAAVALTLARRSAYWLDATDADAIGAILAAAGLAHDVAPTRVTHEQLVQLQATDWDFLLARADANGCVVHAHEATVRVAPPAFDGASVVELLYGATLLELDAALDARHQWTGVRATTWSPADQALATEEASDPGVAGPGDLDGDALAESLRMDALPLAHPAVGAEEARAWADAAWLRSRLDRATGRVKCEGIATVRPGDVVTLAGVGPRFSGDVYVTAVRHAYDTVEGWKTHLQFGGVERPRADADDAVSAPRAAGLVPAASGLQLGVVTANEDPSGEGRVRVRLPMVDAGSDGGWARVAAVDAGRERGLFVRPEVGDEVVVGFVADDPRHPVVLGMLHSSAYPTPIAPSDANEEKGWWTRERLRLHLDDGKKAITLDTPGGNAVTLSDDAGAITIADQHGNAITLDAEGITVRSASALKLEAATATTLQAGSSLGLKSSAELKLEGGAGAELSSSGVTKVKGALVQLN